MNQKILGIMPLMVVMLFVVFIAVGDNQTYANPVNQTVTVTVNQAIAIEVETPVTFGAVDFSTTNTLDYWVANVGNVKIDLFARANDTAFRSATATDDIAISGNYFIQRNGAGFFQVPTDPGSVLIYDNMNKANQGSGAPNNWTDAQQQLTIPAYTEDGTYSIRMIYSATKH